MEGQATMTGQMVGTPAFMPPEQFSGGQIDGRSDLYSLGVVLYEMATSELPFPGERLTTVSYKVMQAQPVSPRKLNPALPAKLESVILKCLAKDPGERYQTGEELAQDLGELRGEGKGARIRSQPAANAAMEPVATLIGAHPPVAARPVPTPVLPTPALPTPTGPPPASPMPSVPQRPPTRVAPLPKSRSGSLLGWLIFAIAVAGVWYALQGQHQPAVKAFVNRMRAYVTAATAPSAPTENASKAPKDVDPTQNARLKIDARQVPAGLDLKVEMNGKPFFRWTSGEGSASGNELLVPPGTQEFRVTAKSGALQKASNSVSAEFKAKKRNTLKIEFRGQGASGAQGLSPETQIVATLK